MPQGRTILGSALISCSSTDGCVVLIIDLKVGKFGYSDAAQMHLYLNGTENRVRPLYV